MFISNLQPILYRLHLRVHFTYDACYNIQYALYYLMHYYYLLLLLLIIIYYYYLLFQTIQLMVLN